MLSWNTTNFQSLDRFSNTIESKCFEYKPLTWSVHCGKHHWSIKSDVYTVPDEYSYAWKLVRLVAFTWYSTKISPLSLPVYMRPVSWWMSPDSCAHQHLRRFLTKRAKKKNNNKARFSAEIRTRMFVVCFSRKGLTSSQSSKKLSLDIRKFSLHSSGSIIQGQTQPNEWLMQLMGSEA